MATLGIICGMESEARALGPVRGHERVMVSVTGGRRDRIERAAARMLDEGCIRLLSWGVAGGLDPRLRAGDWVLPERVETLEGETYDLARHAAIGREKAAARPGGLALGVDAPVMTAADRDDLFHATGAQTVDMETHVLARIGHAYAVDTLAIRAVADPARRSLPAFLARALDADGKPRLGAVIGGAALRPWTVPGLVGLARERARALAALRRIAGTGVFSRLLA